MKRSIVVTSSVALLALLVGAVFVGGRLLRDQEQSDDGEGIVMVDADGMTMSNAQLFEIEPPDELPAALPDVAGPFVRREDNSLFVRTGNVMNFSSENSPQSYTNPDGPVIEVIITRDTLIYRDDTLQQSEGGPPSGPMQQKLNPGSLDEIGANSTVSVWGDKRGDRVIAEILVFYTRSTHQY